MRCLLLVTFVVSLGGACAPTREARAIQPFPVHTMNDVPSSTTLYIHERDMNLPHDYQMRSSAQFTVVSRDRLRFHVGIVRFFEDDADTSGWTAWLVDEAGNKYAPEDREVARVNRISIDWALYPWSPGDTWCPNARPCKSRIVPGYQVYQGLADYMFHVEGLFTPARQKLMLVLKRGSLEMHYVWRFGDTTDVHNYGRSHIDDEMGTIILPGPDTQIAGTRYEGDLWHDSGERP